MKDECKKYILVDVDGVLLDWRTAFFDWMREKGHEPAADDLDEWQLDQAFPSLESVGIVQYIRQFNESARIGFLKAYPDAKEYINKLKGHGFGFIAVTAMGTDQCACALRMRNLIDEFNFNFDLHVFTDLGESKKSALKNLRDTYRVECWVEDKVSNAVDGADLGIPTYLIKRFQRNTTADPRIIVVSDWKGIYNTLEG